MGKTFMYEKVTGKYYSNFFEEFIDEVVDIEYEVSDEKLLNTLCDIVFEEHFYKCNEAKEQLKPMIKQFILKSNILNTLIEYYEKKLMSRFEIEALESYDN